jgi:hypothetical protein
MPERLCAVRRLLRADAIRRSRGDPQKARPVSIRLDTVRQLPSRNAAALVLIGRRLVEGLDGLIA